MPEPVIHLVRHAQGFHNLGAEFHSLRDPRLTPLGEAQCAQLQKDHFPPSRQESISLITASPMTRTLHTAYLTFSPALSNGKCRPEILAIPDAQETSDFPCDTGSDLSVLKDLVKTEGWPVDLSIVPEGWNVKTLTNRYSPAGQAIQRRARDTRVLLREKARELVRQGDENAEIVLVAHGAYMHYISNDWEGGDKFISTGWENCECRTYTFEAGFLGDDPDAMFTETMESRLRHGKPHPMISHDKQTELLEQTMQAWEKQGCQNPMKILIPAAQDESQGAGIERPGAEIQVKA